MIYAFLHTFFSRLANPVLPVTLRYLEVCMNYLLNLLCLYLFQMYFHVVAQRANVLQLLFFCQILVWPQSALTKLTFLFFYLRIFPHQHIRTAVFVLMGLTGAWFIAFEISNIVNCVPVSYFWTSWDGEHEGHCIQQNDWIYAGASLNIGIDFAIIVLPLTELYKLQMSTKRKAAIMTMFSVGILYVKSSQVAFRGFHSIADTTLAL